MEKGNKEITIEGLSKLKESVGKSLDSRIESMRIDEELSRIASYPLGKLNFILEGISDRLSDSEKGSKLIATYVKAMKDDKALKEAYTIGSKLVHPKRNADSYIYLTESLKMTKKPSKKSLDSIRNIVSECVKEAKISSKELSDLLENYDKSIVKSVDFIMENKPTPYNVDVVVNEMSAVLSHINESRNNGTVEKSKDIKKDEKELDESYEKLDEFEKKVVYDVCLSEAKHTSKEELFNEYKNGCLSVLSEAMDGKGVDDKAAFESMKAGLEKKMFNESTLVEDLLKMAELSDMIKNS